MVGTSLSNKTEYKWTSFVTDEPFMEIDKENP